MYTHSLEKGGRKATVARLDHWSRYLYPALFLLGLLVIVGHGLAGR